MVKKLQKIKSSKTARVHLTGSVKDSAQQIWQAGLGAFTRAQAEGSKAFESLVKDGVSIQRKTQAAAEEKISEATSKMSTMENIFEERVAKALNKLGVPSAKDVNSLITRIEELSKAVQKLSPKAPTPKAPAKKSAAPKAKVAAPKLAVKAAAKPAAKRATPARKVAAVAATEPTAPAQA
jgi:poly(hydroxyalkanoate) granule-associated protein